MKFLADMGISVSTIKWLQEKGHAAAHVRDAGMHRASDAEIVEKAKREMKATGAPPHSAAGYRRDPLTSNFTESTVFIRASVRDNRCLPCTGLHEMCSSAAPRDSLSSTHS